MPDYDDRVFQPPAPVARVGLRNPDSHKIINNVLMVIDTGADMTFIPRSAVNDLELQLVSGEGYELKAFDGKSSVARAVRADMLFLGRTFKGLYLVRQSEIGILGRDVLNHFAILLDGPKLHWTELSDSVK